MHSMKAFSNGLGRMKSSSYLGDTTRLRAPVLEFRLMSHKDRSQFLHAVPHPIEGLTPGHTDIRVPTSSNGLWRLY